MKCYVIPPLSHLGLMNEGDSFFCLAQLYRDNENYRQFFKKKVSENQWVTLDNGIGDHNPITQDELFDIMKDLMPSEVIPVDTLFDSKKTVENALDFIKRMKEEDLSDKIEVFGCPQGNTLQEWLDCYKLFLSIPEVKTIGISKLSIPWVISRSTKDQNISRDRNVMFDYLRNEDLLQKPLHFLGAGEFTEFVHYKGCEFVRSTDSCFTVWAGMNGIKFDENYRRIPTPKNYFNLDILEDKLVVIQENISIFRSLLND